MNDFAIAFAGQTSLPGMCPISEAVQQLSTDSGRDERGAIFTRREVVDFMLDLIGYTADRDLPAFRVLEPSFGGGDFVLAVVIRLVEAWRRRGGVGDLASCLHAVELHRSTFETTRNVVRAKLVELGFEANEACRLTQAWLHVGDFLLAPIPGQFDFVVGNPPYVRQELIPAALIGEYRRRFTTLYDRADLYVPFIERSLILLNDGGQMSFICADRWTKNKYGGPLRAMVSEGFALRAFVNMTETQAFDTEVVAYPAITLIERTRAAWPTFVAENPAISPMTLAELARALRGQAESPSVRVVLDAVQGSSPWLLTSGQKLDIIRRLEARLPTLEEVGCKVGIGVATGADRAFIGPFDELDVEPSRKLPLVTTKDLASGHVVWKGLGVVNPFEDDGSLVDLAKFPKFAAHLEKHRPAISGRHVAKKRPDRWYRTIDRITPSLAAVPKLLIPDIKGEAQVAYEAGRLYPHHNLYFVTSTEWNLHALQAVLLSRITREFIRSYSTAMRGGFLRFQAQYLRRIRIPRWAEVSEELRVSLARAAKDLDLEQCDAAAAKLYGLCDEEMRELKG